MTKIEGWRCLFCLKLYSATYGNVVHNNWCPCRKNKTQTLVKEFLLENFENVKCEYKSTWNINPETNVHLPFDFRVKIDDIKIIIELDGRAHFEDVVQFKSNGYKNMCRDVYKMKKAIKNGYKIIRIFQEDIWDNKIEWGDKLQKKIKLFAKEKTSKDVIYISLNKKLYNDHKDLLENYKPNKEDILKSLINMKLED